MNVLHQFSDTLKVAVLSFALLGCSTPIIAELAPPPRPPFRGVPFTDRMSPCAQEGLALAVQELTTGRAGELSEECRVN
jgi:hypothetical protein